jgi:hypothetical protein
MAPNFTDFGLHNTGATQEEYDAVHGQGAFAALAIPDLLTRNGNVDSGGAGKMPYLPTLPPVSRFSSGYLAAAVP